MKRVLFPCFSLVFLLFGSCSLTEDTSLTDTKLFLDGNDPLTVDLNGVAPSKDEQDRVISSEVYHNYYRMLTKLTPTDGVDYLTASATTEKALLEMGSATMRAACSQLTAIHMLSHFLLVKDGPIGEKATSQIARWVDYLATHNPSEAKVIYTGLTHLSEVWDKEKIQAIASLSLAGVQLQQAQRAELRLNRAGKEPETTLGGSSMVTAIRTMNAEIEQKEVEYTRYLEALISK